MFSPKNVSIVLSNRPVRNRSEMMMGLDVAPVAPSAMFLSTRSGSTESSHSFVPACTNDLSDMTVSFSLLSFVDVVSRATSTPELSEKRSYQLRPQCLAHGNR